MKNQGVTQPRTRGHIEMQALKHPKYGFSHAPGETTVWVLVALDRKALGSPSSCENTNLPEM